MINFPNLKIDATFLQIAGSIILMIAGMVGTFAENRSKSPKGKAKKAFFKTVTWTGWLVLGLTVTGSLVSFYSIKVASHEAERDKEDLLVQFESNSNQMQRGFQITTNQLMSQIADLKGQIGQLIEEFSTNSAVEAPLRLAVLNDESAKAAEKITELQGQHEVLGSDKLTLQSLRDEYEFQISNREAIAQQQKQQAEIQQQIANIQAQEQQRRDQKQAELDAEQEKKQKETDEEAYLSKQRDLAKQILPVFDHAVRELSAILGEIASETKTNLYSDFPGQSPTIYSSEMVSNGIIVEGRNFIRIGTNGGLRFRISTSITPDLPPENPWNRYRLEKIYGRDYGQRYITLTINGGGSLVIKPMILWRDTSVLDTSVKTVSITLQVPNDLGSETSSAITNCEAPINRALRTLVEAADHERPFK